jgi:hypothetical protein
MTCPITTNICNTLVEKYSFLKSINLHCVDKDNSSVYMDPSIVVDTTPLPETYFDLKRDVYDNGERTNKKDTTFKMRMEDYHIEN